MFGLTIKEQLLKEVVSAVTDHILSYRENVTISLNRLQEMDDAEFRIAMVKIRKEYLDSVKNSVLVFLKKKKPSKYNKVCEYLLVPSKCGFEDCDVNGGIMAGTLYAICYYAMKGYHAEVSGCVALNHFQTALMNEIIDGLKDSTTEAACLPNIESLSVENIRFVLKKCFETYSSNDEIEYVSEMVEHAKNSGIYLNFENVKEFMGIILFAEKKGKNYALKAFDQLVEAWWQTVDSKQSNQFLLTVSFFYGALNTNGIITQEECDTLGNRFVTKYIQKQGTQN